MRSLSLAAALLVGCALTGCEGTLGPSDAPNSRDLYYLYGLDEGPNAVKQPPSSLNPRWRAEAVPYRLEIAPVQTTSTSLPATLLTRLERPRSAR